MALYLGSKNLRTVVVFENRVFWAFDNHGCVTTGHLISFLRTMVINPNKDCLGTQHGFGAASKMGLGFRV